MTLTSVTYLIFLLICVTAFYYLPVRFKPAWLLLCSAGFYLYTMPGAFFLMMVYAWIIYGIGCWKSRSRRIRRRILLSGVAVSVLFLFVYKYLGFTLSVFTGGKSSFALAAPIGISYVTLQGISYLVEISRKKSPIVKNPVVFFTYLLFFPKITAGPVESPQHFFGEIKAKREFSIERSLEAVGLICTGLAKKLVVADSLAPGVAAVFDRGMNANGLASILAVVMYSLQILFDFSGYTDIARGSAMLFGIDLTENFKAPYLAGTVSEFWRRWHISLSTWLKNYIYIPIGGSRRGRGRKLINVMITFLVSGIWHGAAFTFIFWGILHGLYQVLEMLLHPSFVKARALLKISEEGRAKKILGAVRTFIMVSVAWVFFRAESLGSAFTVLKSCFNPWTGIGAAFGTLSLGLPLVLLIIFTAVFTSFYKMRTTAVQEHSIKLVIVGCVIMIWCVLLSLLLAPEAGSANTFIYFNF